MPNTDNSTVEVDLDKAFESKETKSEETNSENTQTVEFDLNKFLNEVDAEIAQSTYQKENKPEAKVESKIETKAEDDVEKLKQEVETLKKRYSDSSREGKKVAELEKRLSEVEPAEKLYRTILADPKLTDMIVGYIEKGEIPSDSLKDQLGLPEDFVFDPEDIAKPGTDSYKFFENRVAKTAEDLVNRKLGAIKQQEVELGRKAALEKMKNEFVSKYGEDALGKVEEYMNNNPLTLDHVWSLMNLNERDKKIATNAANAQAEQVRKNQGKNPSLVTKEGVKVHENTERKIIDALNALDGEIFK